MVKKATSTTKKGKSKSSASTKSVEVQKAAGKTKKVTVKKTKAKTTKAKAKTTKAKVTKTVTAAPVVKQETVVNELASQVSSTQQSSGVTELLAQLATRCAEAATRQKAIAPTEPTTASVVFLNLIFLCILFR